MEKSTARHIYTVYDSLCRSCVLNALCGVTTSIYCIEARQTEFSFPDSFLLFILFFPFKIDYSSTRLTRPTTELGSTKITMHTVFIARKEKKPIQVPARISKLHAY